MKHERVNIEIAGISLSPPFIKDVIGADYIPN